MKPRVIGKLTKKQTAKLTEAAGKVYEAAFALREIERLILPKLLP
jgi:hypothetical protein